MLSFSSTGGDVNKVRLGLFGFVFVGIVCVGIFQLVRGAYRGTALKPFESHLAGWSDKTAMKPGQPKDQPYVTGKIMIVDITTRQFDNLYFDLPDALRAETPEAVKTVVWLERRQIEVGRYTGGSRAIRHVCRATVADATKKQVVGSREFEGGMPPDRIKDRLDHGGSSPDEDILNWLGSLPRR